jgi:predicted nuclease of predicted toxin-antitoxin system
VTNPEQPVFFIDWCLGKTVANALARAGAHIEHHGDHFDQNTPDTEWLSVVGDRGWVVLTKDQAIGSNALELKAIARANVKIFSLASGNLTRQQMADLFVDVLGKITRFTQGNQAPFISKGLADKNNPSILERNHGNEAISIANILKMSLELWRSF